METKTSTSESKSEIQSDDEFAPKRISEEELRYTIKKVERDWPVRCKLAELAGFKASSKNPRALMDSPFDLSIQELYLEVQFRRPENLDQALKIIKENQAAVDADWVEYQAAVKAAKDAKRKKK